MSLWIRSVTSRYFTKRLPMASNCNNAKRASSENSGPPAKKPFGHWSLGLKASMEDPELQVYVDSEMVIIKDKYPKARFHFLVLPKQSIASLKRLQKDHLPLLRRMQKEGESIASKSSKELTFRYGYHAIPSMSHVHMHVISQDFDSPCLKHKKHWNSFTSEYFIDSTDVIKMLEEKGKIEVDTSKFEAMLKQPLKCHKCGEDFSTMPNLKRHLLKHIPKSISS